MAQSNDGGIKIRCPYCRRVFLFKPKKKDSETAEGKINPRVSCPYCEASIQLPKV